jgi:hypothetical protein
METTRSLGPSAQLALDAILGRPTRGIPIWLINPMEHTVIDRIAGAPEGTYRREPVPTYLQMLRNSACCMVDQFIPTNPLSMGSHGYESDTPATATTGAPVIVRDGITIDSPEAVVEHLERFVFPGLEHAARGFDEDAQVAAILAGEREVQAQLAPDMLKTGYGFVSFPGFAYGTYGYENYFMAYALYPEVMERHFSLQADAALPRNRAALQAHREGGLPPYYRLDHDMADSRGTLVDIRSLDRIWFPHFARCLEPLLRSEVKLIWHCDGNLAQMVPRLLEAGIRGFQGFQYEDGMDYEAIAAMKTRDGEPLLIVAGVSVTRTLPLGTADDVRREMQWLVEHGPHAGLFLGGSSSITPGVPWENMKALIDGFAWYREHGRQGL